MSNDQPQMFLQTVTDPHNLTGTWYFKEDGSSIFVPTKPITLDSLMSVPPRCEKHHWHVELRSHEIKTSGLGQVQAHCCHCKAKTWVHMSDWGCGNDSGNSVAVQDQTALGGITRED